MEHCSLELQTCWLTLPFRTALGTQPTAAGQQLGSDKQPATCPPWPGVPPPKFSLSLGLWGVAVPDLATSVPSQGSSFRGTLPTGSPLLTGLSRGLPVESTQHVCYCLPADHGLTQEPLRPAPPLLSPGRGCERGAHSSHWLGTESTHCCRQLSA